MVKRVAFSHGHGHGSYRNGVKTDIFAAELLGKDALLKAPYAGHGQFRRMVGYSVDTFLPGTVHNRKADALAGLMALIQLCGDLTGKVEAVVADRQRAGGGFLSAQRLHLVDLGNNGAGIGDKLPAKGGQGDALVGADKEGLAQLILQLDDGRGYLRLGNKELVGRQIEGAVLLHRQYIFQL